jgi:AraC-like DNA-binding protein
MSKQATSAVWVRGIAELLAAEGLDASALLTAAGIDPAALEAPGARLPTEKISRLWEIAVERSGNPAIGLAQPQVVRPASFDVVGYTMMSCANLQDAFERLVRYLRILSDALTIHRSEERGHYRVSFDLRGGERPVPRQRMEFILVTVATFCRWVSGRDLHPLEVAFSHPAPRDLAPYRTAFRCPVSFDAPLCSLIYALDDLARPLSTSNPTLAALHDRYAGDYLEHFDRGQTSYRVREVIIRRLPDGEPRRDQVARELCMSERTLQRRLEEEASSFLQLLNDTRRELAEQYLNRLHLSLAQAAYLLGFSEQSSFFRACKRWFGLPPGEYRRHLRPPPEAAG